MALLGNLKKSFREQLDCTVYGNEEILGTLWVWGSEVQVNLKDGLLLAKGKMD